MTLETRKQLFSDIQRLVAKEYFDPQFNGKDWPRLVSAHENAILSASTVPAFEEAVNNLLAELGTSQTGIHSPESLIAARNSINATVRRHTSGGEERWMFQDILPGGPADAAGIVPGDILMQVNNAEVRPPAQPAFRMGTSTTCVLVIHRNGSNREVSVTLRTTLPKYAERPYSEPQAVLARRIEPSIGYLKISLFPGMIGVDFARDVDKTIAELNTCQRLVLDLRGNPGGGIGSLALMSYLTPSKIPVGYSLSRQRHVAGYDKTTLPRFTGVPRQKWKLPLLAARFARRDRSIVVVTEGRPSQAWHKRLVVLTNEHTRGSAEMTAAFVRENKLGMLVGTKTGGRLLAGQGFKLRDGFVLVLPVAAYLSWNGHRFEGNGIEPDVVEEWNPESIQKGSDNQIRRAIEIAKAL